MLEAEAPQSSSTRESLLTENARLENKVAQLSREKEELLRKVAHYEEYTKRLCTMLRKLKGSIDGLAGQSALIGEALSYSCEAENSEQNEENVVPEQPQIQAKKQMQTASVLPMVRGFPIRRIIVPLQRLNINSHRHRPNRIHGHRREPWWRETEPETPEPLQETHPHRPGHGQRVPVRRLQRVERRPHRAVVRPRSRPGVRRRQEAAVVERAGAQNRRGGSSHQMLQAVVLLQRLSLTQHQQQQQQRREQEPQPSQAEGVRTPVVMLRDISTTVQVGDRVTPKLEEPAAATSVKTKPTEGSTSDPSVREEGDRAGPDVARAGPSGWAGVVLPAPTEADTVAVAGEAAGGLQSEDTGAAPSDGPEAEVGPCQELPPVLTPAEQGEFTVSAEEAVGEKAAEPPPPPLSPSPLCGGGHPAGAAADEGAAPEDEGGALLPPETILSEMEAMPSSETETGVDASASDDTLVAQPEPAHLHNGDTTTSGQNEEEPSDPVSTPSSSRKRKASASVDSPEKCSGSPRSDVEREQSPHSETEQGSRPRRRCAIRTNYALFFAGWNAD
ncbi:fibrous sheath CABYR-binding protein-like isoform X2 [Schistocerca nitens]|uniref:fibrous sheath CABYR-binding protein-like isoform X2 n=1 Tax=Schistocerca nitens TaxID=7011 RepID=UPI002118BB42|nr:fibrous sheath CABYR-binding protein-like isoform X2 [Schistocerca nitens]